jgi:predicted N-acetyltransferase YhbS
MPAEVRPFLPKRDSDEIGALIKLAFGDWGGPGYAKHIAKTPKSQWKFKRCLVDEGRIVAFLDIKHKEMYIGRALLKMAGIAGVCTHPDTRNKGYGRALFDDTIRFMERENYDISVLYGIPNYYHKFGYEVVMSRHFFTVPQTELPTDMLRFAKSGFAKADMPALLAFYNAHARYRDGNCRRRELDAPKGAFKLADPRGRLAAYAFTHAAEESLVVREAIARDSESARQLLTALRLMAWRQGLTQVNIAMPAGYAVTDVLRSTNCVYHRGNTYRRGCMGRLVNLAPLVAKMQAEWTVLVGRSELASRSGGVSLAVGDSVVRLYWHRGVVKAAVGGGKAGSRVTPERFVQMIHGYRIVGDLSSDKDVTFRPADVRALEVLFPERNAFLFGPDQF